MSDMTAKERRGPTGKRMEELADYDEGRDTGDVAIERPELEQISIRLPKEDLERIKRRATKAGIGYTTLIRMILRAYLDDRLTR